MDEEAKESPVLFLFSVECLDNFWFCFDFVERLFTHVFLSPCADSLKRKYVSLFCLMLISVLSRSLEV